MIRSVVALLAAGWAASTATAQQPSAVVRGVAVSEAGERVAYAVVLLDPSYPQRFADDSGAFAFAGVAPGSYRLIVRQVGFLPFDSAVTVSAATPPLRVTLRRVAVELTELVVSATGKCLRPGPPDSAGNPALWRVFQQLHLNADRYRLLLDQYPFRYSVVRQLTDVDRAGREDTRTDTLVLHSDSRWPYQPGRVVTDDPDEGRSGVRMVHLPMLADFADPAFQETHCFRLAGYDEQTARIRLDFRAADSLREPDVDGSAFLDPVTFQVRSTAVTLTRLSRAAAGVTSWSAAADFRELRPNLIVVERMSAVTALRSGLSRASVAGRTELQRLLRVDFDRGLPDAAVP